MSIVIGSVTFRVGRQPTESSTVRKRVRAMAGMPRRDGLRATTNRAYIATGFNSGSKEGAMTLRLYYHPFSSYCQKVLIALYENPIPFEDKIVDLCDAQSRVAFAAVWPLAKSPGLRVEASGLTIHVLTTAYATLAPHPPRTRPITH